MTALPPDLLIGKVVGRWIDTLADTPTDPDTTPDVTPSTGAVTMSRLQTFSSFMDAEQGDGTMVGVRQRRFVLELDATGEVRVPGTTVPGVWVPHGWYRVDALIDGAPWPSFQIEVTAEHTAESPLDLVAESPIVAEPGARLVVSAAVALRAEDAAVRAEAAQAAAEATVTTAGQILAGAQAALPAAVSDYLTANPPEDGTDGRPVELQVGATHVQWRYQGDVAWADLISLAALIGAPGSPGASAYDVAVSNGFPGTEAEWLASLDGEDGDNGLSVELQATGTHIQWRQEGGTWADLVSLSVLTGADGAPGASAYQVAVANGFVGTEAEWLVSLLGDDGVGTALVPSVSDPLLYDMDVDAPPDLVSQTLVGLDDDPASAFRVQQDARHMSTYVAQADGQYPLTNLVVGGSFETDSNLDGTPDGITGLVTGWSFALDGDALFGESSLLVTFEGGGTNAHRISVYPAGLTGNAGHLHYMCAWVKTEVSDVTAKFLVGATLASTPVAPGDWSFCSALVTCPATGANTQRIQLTRAVDGAQFSIGDEMRVDGFLNIDLTAGFGAGNEPTRQEMDALITALGHFEGVAGVMETTSATLATLRASSTSDDAAERQRSGVVRLMAWNMVDVLTAPEVGRHIVSGIDPDILVGTEAWDRSDSSSPWTWDNTFAAGRQTNSHFYAQYVDFPSAGVNKGKGFASAYRAVETTDSATPSQGLIRTVLLIGGRRVALYVIHNPSSVDPVAQASYVAALYALAAADPEDYKIFAGDWNVPNQSNLDEFGVPDFSAFGPFINAGYTSVQGLDGVWKDTGNLGVVVGYIDNILLSPGLKVLDWDVPYGSSGSDHRPIWADITFTSSPIAQLTNAQTGTTYTPAITDVGKMVELSNAAPITVTLPADTDAHFPVGSRVDFQVTGAGMATFVAGDGATLNASRTVTTGQWSAATARKRAADTWTVIGDLEAP